MGVTTSENFLHKLAKNSFLSLWTYPNVYTDRGKKSGKGHGKELVDLLVVFGSHVLLFSDKHCEFPTSGDLKIDWNRWRKRAVSKSMDQLRGAERWIRKFPERIFRDRECTQPLHAPFPSFEQMIIHSIVVANGAAKACRKQHHQSGSLIICSDTPPFDYPFMVGQPDDGGSFIHVLDEETLEIVMGELDTITDFVEYLTKKERLHTSGLHFSAVGEEELLAFYLKDVGEDGHHDFIIPKDCNHFSIDEGFWEPFKNSEVRKRRNKANEISYTWDGIIEKFNHHAVSGTLQCVSPGGFSDHEFAVRMMASEPRTRRRMLCQSLYDLLSRTPPHQRSTRILTDDTGEFPSYVFLLFPRNVVDDYQEYRAMRQQMLEWCLLCTPLVYPEAGELVGFATETMVNWEDERSEDLAYYDARTWGEKERVLAKEISQNMGLYQDLSGFITSVKEYPDEPETRRNKKSKTNKNRLKRRRKKNKRK